MTPPIPATPVIVVHLDTAPGAGLTACTGTPFTPDTGDYPNVPRTPCTGCTRTARDSVVEHGQLYASGAVLVRDNSPAVERVYPLTEWIEHNQRHGGVVLRRRVIVVERWHEVPRA